MNRPLVFAAAAVVLFANLWAMVSARRNRAAAVGGTVELTERELTLPPRFGDSTVLFLDLRWAVVPADPATDSAPHWLTAAKLTDLGLDCSVPPEAPEARDHYRWLVPVPAYVVLEHEGPAWQTRETHTTPTTRLFAVDAGQDARQLRERYPDATRYAICRGVVSAFLQDWDPRNRRPLEPPRLRGGLDVIPSRLYVPSRYSRLLERWQVPNRAVPDGSTSEPRYAVKVAWGTRHEPWVLEVRELSPPAPAAPEPNVLIDEQGQPRVTDFGLAKRFDERSQLTRAAPN